MRIYLDNAATSWPKPEGVYQAVEHYQRQLGAPAGRSVYAEAAEVERAVAAARRGVARLLAIDQPERVIFTYSGTDGLNLAIHGLLRNGDHVVTTQAEHNSVLRPLAELERRGTIRVTRVTCDREGRASAAAIGAALELDTRLVVLQHASNVTGVVQPVTEAAELAHRRGALVLVDAAQTLGHLPINFAELGCDLLAAPGHKGLLGPLGTGIVALAAGIHEQLDSFRQGGTGTRSEDDHQPLTIPDKYEAGNHNVPGILGLGAGVEFLLQQGVANLHEKSQALCTRLIDHLRAVAGITIHGPTIAHDRVGVVSVSIEGYDPQEVAAMLDAAYQIQVRSGIHCAPLIHAAIGTLAGGGTIRISLGPFTTNDDIDATAEALTEIAAAAIGT